MTEIKREPWMLGGQPRNLGFARDNGIKHTVWKITVDDDRTLDFGGDPNTITRVEFGQVSKETYDKLMSRYGGKNFVAYDKDHNYWLEDFLPPKVQAYTNRWLFPQEEVKDELPWEVGDFRSSRFMSKQSPASSVGMNCWTTLLDIYRDISLPVSKQIANFFYVNADEAQKEFEKNASLVQGRKMQEFPISLKDKSATERNQGRTFGDLLYIKTVFQPFGPAHVAMWIDEDLYFEKTNFSEDDPIRLAFFEQVVGPYLSQDVADDPDRRLKFRFYPQSLSNDPTKRDAAIPQPQKFAGDYPFDPVPGTQTSREQVLQKLDGLGIRQKYYFTLDTGLGGGLTAYSIAEHKGFPIGRAPFGPENENLRRAYLIGADQLSSFSTDDIFCTSESGDPRFPDQGDAAREFDYKITVNGDLLVRSRKTGQRVATLAGQFITENQSRTLSNGIVAESEQVRKILDTNGRNQLIDTTTENILVFPVAENEQNQRRVLSVFTPKDTNRPVLLEHPGALVTPVELKCEGDIRSFGAARNLNGNRTQSNP
jgi:hypothetical protein